MPQLPVPTVPKLFHHNGVQVIGIRRMVKQCYKQAVVLSSVIITLLLVQVRRHTILHVVELGLAYQSYFHWRVRLGLKCLKVILGQQSVRCLIYVRWSMINKHKHFTSFSPNHPATPLNPSFYTAPTCLSVEAIDILITVRSSFPNLVPCKWNPEFSKRRYLDYRTENCPYIEWLAQLGLEGNVETHVERDDEENVIRVFMRSAEESDICLPRADGVGDFCNGANLDALRAKKGKVGEPLVAWLEERSSVGGTARSRAYRGPLTAHDLYRELKRPVRCSVLSF